MGNRRNIQRAIQKASKLDVCFVALFNRIPQIGETYPEGEADYKGYKRQQALFANTINVGDIEFPEPQDDGYKKVRCKVVLDKNMTVKNIYPIKLVDGKTHHLYWGYLHINGKIYIYRLRNHMEVITAAKSPLTEKVITPFLAKDIEDAKRIVFTEQFKEIG